MKESKKFLQVVSVLSLIVAVLGISVGFASMSNSLTINGTTDVKPANWSVHFKEVRGPELLYGAEEIKAPVISQKDTHISDYAVKLTKPGDKAVYYIDVTNDGDIDSMITANPIIATPVITASSLENKENDERIVRDNLIYTVTYEDGSEIKLGDELKAKNGYRTKTIKIVIEYNEAAEEIPSSDVNITGLDVTLLYGQKN